MTTPDTTPPVAGKYYTQKCGPNGWYRAGPYTCDEIVAAMARHHLDPMHPAPVLAGDIDGLMIELAQRLDGQVSRWQVTPAELRAAEAVFSIGTATTIRGEWGPEPAYELPGGLATPSMAQAIEVWADAHIVPAA